METRAADMLNDSRLDVDVAAMFAAELAAYTNLDYLIDMPTMTELYIWCLP